MTKFSLLLCAWRVSRAFLWCAPRFAALLVWLAWLGACYQPSKPEHTEESGDAGHQAAEVDGGVSRTPVRHSTCAEALVDMPDGPTPDDSGVPGPDCNNLDAGLVECSPDSPCPYVGVCLAGELGGPGVCAFSAECPDGVPIVHADGSCLSCVSTRLKNALCCSRIAGFDCRGYPGVPARQSRPGELCFEHADCEPGLWCAHTPDLRPSQGRCICPGVDATSVLEPPECTPPSEPASWRPVVHPLEHCQPALADEFSVEPLQGGKFLDAVAAPDGSLHVFSAVGQDVFLHSQLPGQAFHDEAIDGLRADSLSAVVDAENHLHVLALSAVEGSVVYATNQSDTWALEALTSNTNPFAANLLLDASGAPQFSYMNVRQDIIWGSLGEAGYRERTVVQGWNYSSDFLLIANEPTWLVSDGSANVQLAVFRDDELLLRPLVFRGTSVSAAETSLGELFIAYTPFVSLEVLVTHMRDESVEEHSLWAQKDPRIVNTEMLWPTLALDKDDRPSVAFVTPHDVSLARWQSDAWSTTALVSDVPEGFTAKVVIDAGQKRHVFYSGPALHSLRHVFEGACANETPE